MAVRGRLRLAVLLGLTLGGVAGTAAAADRVVLSPTADLFVDAGRPRRSFAASGRLRVGATPSRISFLRFVVRGTEGRPIHTARLWLAVGRGSGLPGTLALVQPGGWGNTRLTFAARPGLVDEPRSGEGLARPGEVVEFRLDDVVQGDGTFEFALLGAQRRAIEYFSSRARRGQHPALVLVLGEAPAPAGLPVQAATIEFEPVADAHVEATSPTTNFGTSPQLKVDASPLRTTYLRFNVAGTDDEPVVDAVLRLTVDPQAGSGASSSGGTLHELLNSQWQEAKVTYGTRPTPLGPVLATQGRVMPGQVVEFRLPPDLFTGDGTYDFALDSAVKDNVGYRSREAASGSPRLVLTLAVSPTTTTTTSPTNATTSSTATSTTTSEPTTTSSSTTTSTTTTTRTPQTTTTLAPGPDVGFFDFSYGPGVDSNNNRATAAKPESKLWYHDGFWWATLYSPTAHGHRIHQLSASRQTWIDTGVLVDERRGSRQDVLADGDRLYVVSRFAGAPAQNRFIRFGYDDGTHVYVPDTGYPVNIPGGGTESMSVAKDSTGRLWIAYTLASQVYVGCTSGTDAEWSAPFVVPGSAGDALAADDIATVQALRDGTLGVFWSNQVTETDYFAVHLDEAGPADPEAWHVEIAAQGNRVADDHFNLKVTSDNRLLAAIKTSRTAPSATLIGVLERSPQGHWSPLRTVATVQYTPTRPALLLDEDARRVYVFYSDNTSGIYFKTSSLDAIAFPAGRGTPFIQSAEAPDLNNPTTTKQNVSAMTGLVVEASSPGQSVYWHNALGVIP